MESLSDSEIAYVTMTRGALNARIPGRHHAVSTMTKM